MTEPIELTPGVTMRPLPIPDSIDDRDFRTYVDVCNASEVETTGFDDLTETYEEMFPRWKPRSDERSERFLIEAEGSAIGMAVMHAPLREAPDLYHPRVIVLEAWAGRGIGTAAARALDAIADDWGRSRSQVWAIAGAATGETLTPSNGFGSVPADARSTRLLLAQGYLLSQVERISRLDLVTDRESYAAALAAAWTKADGYELVEWSGRTPERWEDDMAWLNSRMSTDVPAGDLQVDEEVWDVERLREGEERTLAGGIDLQIAAARHIASDRLVGYSSLNISTDRSRAIFQGNTIVAREHRGHRLGMLVKAANLVTVADQGLGDRVWTWNAEENRPMLDVNEALGFAPVGYEGVWERRR